MKIVPRTPTIARTTPFVSGAELLAAAKFFAWLLTAAIASLGLAEAQTVDGQQVDHNPSSLWNDWRAQETQWSLAVSGIDELFRVHDDTRNRPRWESIIQHESEMQLRQNAERRARQLASTKLGKRNSQASPTTHLNDEEWTETVTFASRVGRQVATASAEESRLPGLSRLASYSQESFFPPVHVDEAIDPGTSIQIHRQATRLHHVDDESTPIAQPPGPPIVLLVDDAVELAPTAASPTERDIQHRRQETTSARMRDDSNPANAMLSVVQLPVVNVARATGQTDRVPQAPSPTTINDPTNRRPIRRAPVESIQRSTPKVPAVPRPEPATSQTSNDVSRAEPIAAEEIEDESPSIAQRWPLTMFTDTGNVQLETPKDSQTVELSVQQADVRTVLEMLAKNYQLNILVAPEVTGVVTANVSGLSPRQTLDGILKMSGLKAIRDDGLIFVHRHDNVPSESRQLRMFPLDFARAEAIEPTVQGLLSPVGNAYISTIDPVDNLKSREAIVVVDVVSRITEIESYILQVDQPPQQVMVEARVLEVQLTDDLFHGVNLAGFLRGDLVVGGQGLTIPRTGLNLFEPASPTFFASIDGNRIGSLIDLLEETTDAKTLAAPSVTVINGQQAKILVGDELGYPVTTVNVGVQTQTIEFLEVGVSLEVRPTISRDGKIMMHVRPEVSSGEIDFSNEIPVPSKGTRQVDTSVLLDNHEGMVIGGLIREDDRTVIKKLPWLGDVKYVGKLFQRRDVTRNRTEIIVTLIPHIVEQGCQTVPACLDCEQEVIKYQRAATPLLHGPLHRNHRPWEARLPDSTGSSPHLDVNRVNRMLP